MNQRIISDDEVIIPDLRPTEPVEVVERKLQTPSIISGNPVIRGYVIGADQSVSALLNQSEGFAETENTKKADFFVFTGGADINPQLYNEEPLQYTHPYIRRDEFELEWYANIPDRTLKFGICRGGQLLNVLSGGSMFQHVDGHQKYHEIYDLRSKRMITASSVHHQMMRLGDAAKLLAVGNQSTFRMTQTETFKILESFQQWSDPEVAWYENTNSLCVQGHPEYSGAKSPFGRYCMDLVREFFSGHSDDLNDSLDDILPHNLLS
jgi:hypothetical protein